MNKIKKILVSFSLGLMLAVIPITALAKSNLIIKRLSNSGCPPAISLEFDGLNVSCVLFSEMPYEDGVTICAYNCYAL